MSKQIQVVKVKSKPKPGPEIDQTSPSGKPMAN